MKPLMIIWLFVYIGSYSYAACSGSGQTWMCAAGSTSNDIQTAIDNSSDGAIISFSQGNYSGWSLALPSAKGITLKGAGIDKSIVSASSNMIVLWDNSSTSINNKKYRITGFTFQNGGDGGNMIHISAAGGANPKTFSNIRIHHNRFHNLSSGTIAIRVGTPEYKTIAAPILIDHNQVTGPDQTWDFVHYVGGDGLINNRIGSLRGTNSNLFVEDNNINFDAINNMGIGTLDSHSAAAIVFRKNKVKNAQIGSHGVSHGATANYEVYQNSFERTAGSFSNGYRMLMHQGSGEITYWDNSFSTVGAIHPSALEINHYRSYSISSGLYPTNMGQCNGGGQMDGNLSGLSGWPCWMQPGRSPNGGAYGQLSPMYMFKNINLATGANVPISIPSDGPNAHVQANRDFYQAVSPSPQTNANTPFNGTVGMGYGTLENRPKTCSTGTDPEQSGRGGVGYWATDIGEWNILNGSQPDGQLYRCTSGNVWVLAYLPYTYPHPLQVENSQGTVTPPKAPTNLRIK